jgi:hypothetical protein
MLKGATEIPAESSPDNLDWQTAQQISTLRNAARKRNEGERK